MRNNQNPSLCSGCGACCKTIPGIVHPSEMKEVTVSSLTEMFKKGYQFDYYEGNLSGEEAHKYVTFYYLRPQTKKSVGKMVDASWGGECVFLNEKGCSMEFDERPKQCRALNPDENKNCSLPLEYRNERMILDWLPYNEIIRETIIKYNATKE